MYLPDKIIKTLEMIDSPYKIYYKNSQISSIDIESESIKIYSSNARCYIKLKGASVYLDNFESLEKLLIKFNIINKKKSNKVKTNKSRENLISLFSKLDKDMIVSYSNTKTSKLLLVDDKAEIHITDFGYKVQLPSGEIGAKDIKELKVILQRMNIIPKDIKKEKKVKKNDTITPGIEQLMLSI